MTWRLVGTNQLATVQIPEPGAPPVLPPLGISEFVTQHKLLKSLIEKAGGTRQCLTLDKIVQASGLSRNDVDRHIRIFEMDNYTTKINKDAICSVEAVNELKAALKKKRRMT